MSIDPAPLVASSSRPCSVRARADLVVRQATYQGSPYWLVKDAVALEYHRLHPAQYALLSLLDGARSLEQVRAAYLEEFPTQRLAHHDLQLLIADFHAKGLVVSDRPGQAEALLERARRARIRRVWQTFENILYLRLPGWDPERTLEWLDPLAGWMFRPWGVCGCLLLMGASFTLLAVETDDLVRELPTVSQFFGWPNLFWLWLTLGAAKILHELGHGLSCRSMGGECHEIGVAFLVFSPCLYCDVSDSWMLPEKWRRIIIAAAGMYVEFLVSAVAILVWWSTHPGLPHFLALQTFLVTVFTTVLLNLNPLLQFDGYYILSDLLEIPNLRAKADRLCAQFVARVGFGIEAPPDPFMPESGRIWFVLYSAASLAYRLSLVFSISFILYQFLRPYGLHHLAFLSAAAILVRMGLNAVRMLSAPRIRPMSMIRTAATLTVVAAGGCALLLIPVPIRTELPFVVEPRGVRHVYASTSGQLATIRVKPGQTVRQGDVLLELKNFAHEDYLARLRTARKVQQVELSLQRKLNDAGGIRMASELVDRLEEQIVAFEEQLARLTVVAPCSGRVVAPPAARQPAGDGVFQPAPRWYGSPLAPQNIGAWIGTGTHLASIAPDARCDALVVIEQNQRDEMAVGCAVDLKCDCRPEMTWTGTLVAIADRHVESVADALSNKYGGPVPTMTAPDGHERLLSDAFEGLVELPDAAPPLLPGMQGIARFTVNRRTAVQWLWRYLKTTFHFRM